MVSFHTPLVLGVLLATVLPSSAQTTTTIACRSNIDCQAVPIYSDATGPIFNTCSNTAGSCDPTNKVCIFPAGSAPAPSTQRCQAGCSDIGFCPGPSNPAVLPSDFVCKGTISSASTVCNSNPIAIALAKTAGVPAGYSLSPNQPCAKQYFCNGTATGPAYCPIPLATAVSTLFGVVPIAVGDQVPEFATNATTCRCATDLCDAPEVCPGTSFSCPAVDGVLSNTTKCRDASGVCDNQAFCTGSSKVCPANGFKSNATVCRNSTGTCDPAETCTGFNATCPTDVFASATTVCGNASGICFNASLCSGNSSACLLKPVANGTACGNSTSPATCNGAGTCSLTCLPKQTACSKTTPPCCARCDGTKYVCRKNSAGQKLCLACIKSGNKCQKNKECCSGTCKNGKCT